MTTEALSGLLLDANVQQSYLVVFLRWNGNVCQFGTHWQCTCRIVKVWGHAVLITFLFLISITLKLFPVLQNKILKANVTSNFQGAGFCTSVVKTETWHKILQLSAFESLNYLNSNLNYLASRTSTHSMQDESGETFSGYSTADRERCWQLLPLSSTSHPVQKR